MRVRTTALAATLLGLTALTTGLPTATAAPAGTTTTAVAHPAAAGAPAGPPGRRAAPPGPCATGQLCLWAKPEFTGTRQVHELSGTDVDSCVALPAGRTAQSLANRTGRPVTTYQSAVCAETGEFQTYPGDGVWLPQSPYQVRAFKVWEN
ncbi:peptidase inhibitor family I36 protein [Streptomyces sp. NPDC097619]|uniref:peptidase inhibitor family I36 protein n=1 Tax=Streptomyces sp. NPDC097619 TaxID=3157228 RepID=UPI0033296D98